MPRAKKRVTYSHRFICTELSTTASVRLKMVDQKMLGSNGVRQLWILSIWEFIGILLGTNPLGIRWQFERVWALCASTSGAKAWRLQPGRVSLREWVSSLECLQHDAVR